ncbi:MAG: penicillin-binding protein [Pseudomonadota bacterium]
MMRKPASPMRTLRTGRVWVVGLLLSSGFALVAARTVQVQLLHGTRLRGLAEEQYLKEIEITAPRGNIYDRTGRTLAVSVAVESVYVDPRRFDQAKLPVLASTLGLKVREIEKRLKGRKTFAWIQRQVPPQRAQGLRALKLAGVYFTTESKRYYPNRDMAGHVLGFVGLDGKGLAGVELQNDEAMRGRTMDVGVLRDARGTPLSTGNVLPVLTLEGDHLHLTLDAAVQQLTEEVLARTVAEYQAAAGMVVVLEPATGALLAMAAVPEFNPNDPGKAKAAARRNRIVTDVFEPGSTLKPLVVAAALEKGAVKANERVYCEKGSVAVGRHVIRDTHSYEWLDVGDVIAKSSNIGTLKIGTSLGAENLHAALTALGFGQRSGIGLPGEVSGMLAPARQWSRARLATVSFGQGIGVTALQLAAGMATIASGGEWKAPYLVDHITAPDGTVRWQHPAPEPRRVFSNETARAMTGMMERVVAKGGTGERAAIEGIRVAGKTGTAQKVDVVSGGYSADKRISSFIGFAPAERPRVLVLVVIDEPQGSTYGGVVAAPAFREIMRGTLAHLGVSVAASPLLAVAEPIMPTTDEVAGAIAISDQTSALPTAGSGLSLMPDLRGMDLRRAATSALATGRELEVHGQGRVVEQDPAAGAALNEVEVIRLHLREGQG